MPYLEEYRKARGMGLGEYRASLAAGIYPYPQVLEELLGTAPAPTSQDLGLVDIPLDLIRGTRFPGRKAAFSKSFLPLLGEDTEFAAKWVHLCQAHLEEGIQEPIQAVEYLGRFYVEEGNKRVSVLRYFGAASLPGRVTRLIPPKNDSREYRVYCEYLDFYRDTGINLLLMTRPGNYARLCKALGHTPGVPWTREERREFAALFARFRNRCLPLLPEGETVGDALVTYLSLYSWKDLESLSSPELDRRLDRIAPELKAAGQNPEEAVNLELEPQPAPFRILDRIYSPKQRVAFLYQGDPASDAWTAAHEFGRCQLGETLGDRVETFAFPLVQPGVNDQEAVDRAAAMGCSLIFTTTPLLIQAARKGAVDHPQIQFLNCSLQMPYPSVRTYYPRMYEVKFLLGAIAGAMSPDGRIGYLAQAPLYGTLAEINAFALGAALVNQQARVFLRWNCLADQPDPESWFRSQGISLLCHRDFRPALAPGNQFGLYLLEEGGRRRNLAAPFWYWGRYYQRLLELLLGRLWPHSREETRAVNYWWGLASGVVDLLLSRSLPLPTQRLVETLRQALLSGDLDPFDLPLTDGKGVLRHAGGPMEPQALLQMDWLVDRVEGALPRRSQVLPQALPLLDLQGVLPPDSVPGGEVP